MSEIELPPVRRVTLSATTPNPFVSISDTTRTLVIFYFVLWRIFPALLAPVSKSSTVAGYDLLIAVVLALIELLVLLPFMLRRIGSTPIGWLHPLILPTVVAVLFGIMRDPHTLLSPFALWLGPRESTYHMLLVGWSDIQVLKAQLKLSFLNLLALVFTYAGFTLKWRAERWASQRRSVEISGPRIAIFFVIALLVGLVFLQFRGGLIEHMTSLAGGRFRMREMNGQYLIAIVVLPYLLILWYAYRRDALGNLLFVIAFLLSAALQFAVVGSRSGMFTPLAFLLSVWIYHNHKLPRMSAVVLGLLAVILLGVLGEIRRSGHSGEVSFDALANFDLVTAIELFQEEEESRARDTGLAVAALVPEVRGHLWGATYVSAFAFWIPRSIWTDKPRGAGAHAAALLFQGRVSMQDYEGSGYPIDGAAEAYWNFSYPGVVVIYLLYGSAIGSIARWFFRTPKNPFAVISLIFVNFSFQSPATGQIVPALQMIFVFYIVSLFVSRTMFLRDFSPNIGKV